MDHEPRMELVVGIHDSPERWDLIERLQNGVEQNTEALVQLTPITRWYDLARYCSVHEVHIVVLHSSSDQGVLQMQRERTLAEAIIHPLPLFQNYWEVSYHLAHSRQGYFPRIFVVDHQQTLDPESLQAYGIERQLGIHRYRDMQSVANDWVDLILEVDRGLGAPFRAREVQGQRKGNLLLSHRDIPEYRG